MSGNEQTEGILKKAAKTIGSAAGAVASVAGVHGAGQPESPGKLPKKNKSRLPRRMKKAQKHAHNVA